MKIQDLYEENYKTMVNKIGEELHKWGDCPFHGINIQYCKDVCSSHLISRFSEIPSKILKSYFVDIDKVIIKVFERQKAQNSQHNIEG